MSVRHTRSPLAVLVLALFFGAIQIQAQVNYSPHGPTYQDLNVPIAALLGDAILDATTSKQVISSNPGTQSATGTGVLNPLLCSLGVKSACPPLVINTQSDVANCGAIGNKCPSSYVNGLGGVTCVAGACVVCKGDTYLLVIDLKSPLSSVSVSTRVWFFDRHRRVRRHHLRSSELVSTRDCCTRN